MKSFRQHLITDQLDEGRMKELHTLIQDGKTAEQIARIMKIDVKAIKALMKDFKEESSTTTTELDEVGRGTYGGKISKGRQDYLKSKEATMGLSIDEFESLRSFALGKAGNVWKFRGQAFIKRDATGKLVMYTLLRGGQRDKNAKKWLDWIKRSTKHNVQVQYESVDEHLDEAWTADSVVKNAEIGSKKGYGINIKKTGGVTKTPYKHMLMTMRRDKSVRVTFDFGKDEFEGTPESVALYVNKILGIKESVLDELDEATDNTAAVAKQVKQAVKKYVSGKLGVRSKGGKTRFIMVRADKIDNELRKKVLNVVAPDANVRDESDISYGNISDRIISAGVDDWIEALGLKESLEDNELLDEANHDQRAADKALWNAMKVVGPRAGWKMVKTDPSRFGVDVEITSQKMSKYGDWTLMAWSDGSMMHIWYEHPNGEGSVPEKEFKRVAKELMSESVNESNNNTGTPTTHMDYRQQKDLNESIQRVVLGETPKAAMRKTGSEMLRSMPKDLKSKIEKGQLKVVQSAPSWLGGNSEFQVLERPGPVQKIGGQQDPYLMVIVSNPEHKPMKIFAYYGTHPSAKGALNKFAKNQGLLESVDELDEAKSPVKSLGKEAKSVLAMALNMSMDGGGPVAQDNNLEYFTPEAIDGALKFLDKNASKLTGAGKKAAKEIMKTLGESVELDEAWTLASDDLNAVKKTAQKLAKQSPDLTYYVVKHKDRHYEGKEIPYYEVYQSEDWHLARSAGAKKVVGYGAKVKESVDDD